jgi:hypothetical protein
MQEKSNGPEDFAPRIQTYVTVKMHQKTQRRTSQAKL